MKQNILSWKSRMLSATLWKHRSLFRHEETQHSSFSSHIFFSLVHQIIRNKKSSQQTLSRSSRGAFSSALPALSRSVSFPPFSMLYFAATWPPSDGRNAGNVNIYTGGSQFRAILHHFWHARRPHKSNELIFYGSATKVERGREKKKNICPLLSSGNESFRSIIAFSRIVSGTCTLKHTYIFLHGRERK